MYIKIVKIIYLQIFSFHNMTNMVINPMKTKPQTTPMIIHVFRSLLLLSGLFSGIAVVVSDNVLGVLEVVFPAAGVLIDVNSVIRAFILGVVVVAVVVVVDGDGGRSITVIVVCWEAFPTKEDMQEHSMFQCYPLLSRGVYGGSYFDCFQFCFPSYLN